MIYDAARKTRLYVDHGQGGVASTIAQGYKDDRDSSDRNMQWRPVYHTSRALTKAEQGYGKVDGESLAVYSGIITNKRYLYWSLQWSVIMNLYCHSTITLPGQLQCE